MIRLTPGAGFIADEPELARLVVHGKTWRSGLRVYTSHDVSAALRERWTELHVESCLPGILRLPRVESL